MSYINPAIAISKTYPDINFDIPLNRNNFNSNEEYAEALKEANIAQTKAYVIMNEFLTRFTYNKELERESNQSIITEYEELIKHKDKTIEAIKCKKNKSFKLNLCVSLIALVGIIATIVLSIFFPPLTIVESAITFLCFGVYIGVGVTTGIFALKQGLIGMKV